MRLIVPIILIALLLPYAVGEDRPSGEWLVQPNPDILAACAADEAAEAVAAAAAAAARENEQLMLSTPCSRLGRERDYCGALFEIRYSAGGSSDEKRIVPSGASAQSTGRA